MELIFIVVAGGLLAATLGIWALGGLTARNEAFSEDGDEDRDYPVYTIRGLRKIYPSPAGAVTALRNVNINIGSGLTAIVGPSGGGKTTLLNCIGGLDKPTNGQVWFRGRPLRFDDAEFMRRFRAESVAWVFQELNLLSHQSVIENVALPLLCRGVRRKDALDTARRMLGRLGIDALADRSRDQLSRGQQQRVAIARAFAADASVILADEPTGSLDRDTAEEVMQQFRQLSQSEGKPVLVVTHNHELAQKYCERVLLCTDEGLQELCETIPATGTETVVTTVAVPTVPFAHSDHEGEGLVRIMPVSTIGKALLD